MPEAGTTETSPQATAADLEKLPVAGVLTRLWASAQCGLTADQVQRRLKSNSKGRTFAGFGRRAVE